MIDALLFAVRDNVRDAGFGWDERTCEVMDSGMPPPWSGDWFCAIHQLESTSDMDNAINEGFGFMTTLTRRVTIPLEKTGTQILASSLARKMAKETGLNARAEQLRSFLHMAWGVIQDANTFMIQNEPAANNVPGYCEPARYKGMSTPRLVGGEWFAALPEAEDIAVVVELRFEGARRLQPIADYV